MTQFCILYLLDKFEQLVRLSQFLKNSVNLEHCEDASVCIHLFQYLAPVLIDRREAASLFRHLGHDVRRTEDRLQVKPGDLNLQPLVQNVLQRDQRPLPLSAPPTTTIFISQQPDTREGWCPSKLVPYKKHTLNIYYTQKVYMLNKQSRIISRYSDIITASNSPRYNVIRSVY